ncbi:MAG: RNA polymerase sigma factor [Solirubrobacteraceae bacterium]
MEVSALKLSGGVGLHGRSPLLRLQSDERLVALIRRGSQPAFEVLVARYHLRLLAFCRHLVGSREDAEDVLQEVMAAAYNAMIADERPINVRPWLYRIARNRSLNHLRKVKDVGVDSMDIHFAEFGASTAEKVFQREEFRLLVGDISGLPETQRTALVLREMDALSYEQIAEAMETTVPSIKSLLVRARVSLAEAAEARAITCDEVRDELGELAEGLKRKMSPPVRRHLKNCQRCDGFRLQLKETNKALAALLPLGPLVVLKKLALLHFGHHAGTGATAAGTGATGAGATATGAGASGAGAAGAGASVAGASGAGIAGIGGSGGLVTAGLGAVAAKGAAGLAAAALFTAGAVAVVHNAGSRHRSHHVKLAAVATAPSPATALAAPTVGSSSSSNGTATMTTHTLGAKGQRAGAHRTGLTHHKRAKSGTGTTTTGTTPTTATTTATTPTTATATTPVATTPATPTAPVPPPGRTQTQTVPTVLPPTTTATTPTGSTPTSGTPTAPAGTTPPTSTGTTPPTSTGTTPPVATAPSTTPTATTPPPPPATSTTPPPPAGGTTPATGATGS